MIGIICELILWITCLTNFLTMFDRLIGNIIYKTITNKLIIVIILYIRSKNLFIISKTLIYITSVHDSVTFWNWFNTFHTRFSYVKK